MSLGDVRIIAHVKSEDLTLENIPDPVSATEHDLWVFVHSFHAYQFWGGITELCSALDEGRKSYKDLPLLDKLNHLRSDVFLELRSARHQNVGFPPVDWDSIRAQVSEMRSLLNPT